MGIKRLERRVADLEALEPNSVTGHSDPRLAALEAAIYGTLVSVFGPDTTDYARYQAAGHFYTGPLNYLQATPIGVIHAAVARSKAESIALLQQAVRFLQEQLDDLGESEGSRAARAFEGLRLHPGVESACGDLFRDGHYAEAVRNACLALRDLVRDASSRVDLDGTALMMTVFSPKSPILKFNDLQDDTDRSEQQGMMYLYAGAMLALRNPPSHKLFEYNTERAMEAIAFISFLANVLGSTRR